MGSKYPGMCDSIMDGQGQVRLGTRKLRFDLVVRSRKIAMSYHGCYFHRHDCELNTNRDPQIMSAKRREEEDVTRYVSQSAGSIESCEVFTVVE